MLFCSLLKHPWLCSALEKLGLSSVRSELEHCNSKCQVSVFPWSALVSMMIEKGLRCSGTVAQPDCVVIPPSGDLMPYGAGHPALSSCWQRCPRVTSPGRAPWAGGSSPRSAQLCSSTWSPFTSPESLSNHFKVRNVGVHTLCEVIPW